VSNLFICRFNLVVSALLLVGCLVVAGRVSAIETIAREAIMIDMDTGDVILSKEADKRMPPASMSKLMTLYMLFERLKDGSLSLDDTLRVSADAWRRGGAKSGSSTMFLLPKKRVKISDLIPGIIVQSGNDACIVVAEGLAGSEAEFAEEMTKKALSIGMTRSTFRNSTGWPHPEHLTTARDLATLAKRTIIDFPQYYHYYKQLKFTYNGIKQHNRNPLLYKDMGADGLKTGHTQVAGYGLTSSAVRGGRRLILVVNGLLSKKARSTEPERLLEWGFREFNNYALFEKGTEVETANVWLGKASTVPLIIEQDVKITLARKSRDKMKVTVSFKGPIPAPIKKGDKIAVLKITAPGRKPMEILLSAGADVERLGLIGRLGAALSSILWGHAG
jgi:D-alanyl-D-alanine carboxypeptidase (penicillin-binding protein 5/6)